jgi:ABC-2 type transport system permease protein
MTRLIRAEALRLATTRTYWLLAAGAIALIAGGVAATAAATSFTGGISPARQVLAIAGLAQTVALIAGTLSVTGEFRHQTITPAVLITPRRTPLLAAKLITLAAAGLAYGLAATGTATAITVPLLAARHIPAAVSAAGTAATIAGGAIATALSAALGVGTPRVWWRLDSPQMLWSGWPLSSTVPPPGGTTV